VTLCSNFFEIIICFIILCYYNKSRESKNEYKSKYKCYCNKIYNSINSLLKHKKICKINNEPYIIEITNDLIMKMCFFVQFHHQNL
jgi:hypothetical protein